MLDTPLLQEQIQKNESSQIVDAIFDATPILISYTERNLNFVRVNRAYPNADQLYPKINLSMKVPDFVTRPCQWSPLAFIVFSLIKS